METFIPLSLPPGIVRNGTKYQSKNRWYDSHLVRWVEGALRPVGGWILQTDPSGVQIQASGKSRTSFGWRKNDSSAWLAVGSASKLGVFSATALALTDITPAGLVTGNTDGSQLGGGLGYGLGPYGIVPWGGLGGTVFVDADTWSLDNFGEVLLACLTADGKIYESTPTTQAAQVTNSPTGCRAVCVTPERFVFALGSSSDPRLVQWSDRSNRTVWTPTATNQAGSFPLQTNGRIVAGRRTARETLIWTDADLWGAVYIGSQFVYSFQQRGDSCGLFAPNAIAMAEGAAYWMADGQFFRYDGAVRQIPCDVSDYVFSDLNRLQRAKIVAVPNPSFGEIWWFYPGTSQSGLENDRYVMLNYRTGIWAIGKLARNAGVGTGVFAQPMLWDAQGLLYAHETGQNRNGQVAYIESGPLEIGNGDQVARLQSLLPDEGATGDLTAQFFASFQPEQPETSFGPFQLNARTDLRLTGRQVRVRFAENNISTGMTADQMVMTADQNTMSADAGPAGGVNWRLGNCRLGVIAGGHR